MNYLVTLIAFLPLGFVLLLALAWLLRAGATCAFATVENITLTGGSGIPAVGTILSVLTQTSPGDYLAIGNAGNLKWSLKREIADTTNQGTPWKQSIATLYDGGTVTIDLHYIPGSPGIDTSGAFGHNFPTGLGSLFLQFNTLLSFSLTYPNGTQVFLNGHITEFAQTMDLTKDLMANVTITISGEPVWVSA